MASLCEWSMSAQESVLCEERRGEGGEEREGAEVRGGEGGWRGEGRRGRGKMREGWREGE